MDYITIIIKIPEVPQNKYLDLILNSKLRWVPHNWSNILRALYVVS